MIRERERGCFHKTIMSTSIILHVLFPQSACRRNVCADEAQRLAEYLRNVRRQRLPPQRVEVLGQRTRRIQHRAGGL
jgi:hypothetical protein